jgi:hypothetical protein
MSHAIYRVIGFKIVEPYTLEIQFDDEQTRVINFRPVLTGNLYSPLLDEKFFNQVEIDPEIHTLVWPNGADFDPAILHDWPQYLGEMKKLAKRWASVEVNP